MKKKQLEEERRRKEEEELGPDPELYANRTAIREEEQMLKTGKMESIIRPEHHKMTKEELESKAIEMQKRAEELERKRDERYNTVLKVDDTKDDVKAAPGMQPKFVTEVNKEVYVDHSMDLAESINRKKHYTQRLPTRE